VKPNSSKHGPKRRCEHSRNVAHGSPRFFNWMAFQSRDNWYMYLSYRYVEEEQGMERVKAFDQDEVRSTPHTERFH
jgi:hypothetical protein